LTQFAWAAKLKTLPRVHLKGRFFRMVRAEDADEILSTGPSFAYGGRYNKRGEFGALYLSEDPRTCNVEKLRQVGGQMELLPPQAMGVIDVDIKDVVDLTSEKNLKILGVVGASLIDPVDRVLPQEIGDAARGCGIHALLVHSAVGLGKDLVIFEDSLTLDECRVRVVKIEKWKV
jgi:RES domain-containing protein